MPAWYLLGNCACQVRARYVLAVSVLRYSYCQVLARQLACQVLAKQLCLPGSRQATVPAWYSTVLMGDSAQKFSMFYAAVLSRVRQFYVAALARFLQFYVAVLARFRQFYVAVLARFRQFSCGGMRYLVRNGQLLLPDDELQETRQIQQYPVRG